MARRVATYILRVMGPDVEPGGETWDEFDERTRVVGEVAPVISEAEETISNALPEGYYAKIEDA